MDQLFVTIIFTLTALIIGMVIGYFIKENLKKGERKRLEKETEDILTKSKEKAREVELEARDKALEIRQQAEAEVEKRRSELSREEDRLHSRRNSLDSRTEKLEKREQALNKRQSSLDRRANEIDNLFNQHIQKLEEISMLTREEARDLLLQESEKEARNEMARIIRQIEAEAKEEGENRARELIALAIQRVASEHVVEITTSVVPLPSDDMKGRIIGRNGRNIRAFEQAAGVDVIVDDTPEAITISCFDPVRREVARRSMAKLILDGRIH
ncbi:MAG: Rnase Y domain-containing protein, partial [Planctomycetota bacterium]